MKTWGVVVAVVVLLTAACTDNGGTTGPTVTVTETEKVTATSPPEAEATVTSLVSSGVLTVTSDDSGDRITVGCSATGSLRVNGAEPDAGSVNCSVITSIVVSAGGGSDLILLQRITEVSFTALRQVSVGAGDGDDEVTGGPGKDSISTGDGDDTIYGGTGANQLKAGDGNDLVDGGPDVDYIVTGEGNDVARGQGGGDFFVSAPGHDQLRGGSGNDTFSLFTPEAVGSGTSFEGGSGRDSLKVQNLGRRTTLSDSIIGSVVGDTRIKSIELALLTVTEASQPLRIDAHDFSGEVGIVGGYYDDLIIGGSGDDDLSGYQGDDTILGGPGNDRVDGNQGSDRCDGGPGKDRLVQCETRQN